MTKDELKPYKHRMPRMVRLITGIYNAWIIGGAADPNNEDPRDWDIIVPYQDWRSVAALIPKDATPTLFGGWKFISDGKEIDVWCEDLSYTMLCDKCKFAWQPRLNIRLSKLEHSQR